jgi:hypothetical protein
MKLQIGDDGYFVAGSIFLVTGLGALIVAHGYSLGNGNRMGPGAFPTILAALLAFMGLIGIVHALTVNGEKLGRIALRPAIVVTAGILVFAASVDRFGLVVAIMLLVPILCLAGQRTRWVETLLITLVLIALSVVVFIYGLGLPFTLLGRV